MPEKEPIETDDHETVAEWRQKMREGFVRNRNEIALRRKAEYEAAEQEKGTKG